MVGLSFRKIKKLVATIRFTLLGSIAGFAQDCAVAWGDNQRWQLGAICYQTTYLTNVIAIAAGGWHSVALKQDRTIWAWGFNNYGQLGNGNYSDSNVPVQVSNLTDVTAIVGGSEHSLAILACTLPSAPVIEDISDYDPCDQSGITITFTSGSPATGHDFFRYGLLVQSNVTSPINFNPGDTFSHSYVIRAINGADDCYTDSVGKIFTDSGSCIAPNQVGVGENFIWVGQTISWNSDPVEIGYRVYRGIKELLPNLSNTNPDFCTRSEGSGLTLDVSNDDRSVIDEATRVVYYLITAYNNGGEGPAGNATGGARFVNANGGCQ